MRVIARQKPKGAKPAPVGEGQKSLVELIGRDVEIHLQSEPFSKDDSYLCRPLYVTPSWLGVVSYYRSQMFFDHIPLSTIRYVRGTVYYKRRLHSDPFEDVDFDAPEKVIDLVNKEVIVALQGLPSRPDSEFKTRLIYVKKNWVGVASVFSNRLLPDHIPLTAVRKITKVVPIGRHAFNRPRRGR